MFVLNAGNSMIFVRIAQISPKQRGMVTGWYQGQATALENVDPANLTHTNNNKNNSSGLDPWVGEASSSDRSLFIPPGYYGPSDECRSYTEESHRAIAINTEQNTNLNSPRKETCEMSAQSTCTGTSTEEYCHDDSSVVTICHLGSVP